MAAVMQVRTEVRNCVQGANDFKFYSSAVKAGTSAISLLTSSASAAGVGRTGSDYLGRAAAIAGMTCDMIKLGTDRMIVDRLRKKIEEAQQTIDREMKAYKVISDTMKNLGVCVPRVVTKLGSSACLDFSPITTATLDATHFIPHLMDPNAHNQVLIQVGLTVPVIASVMGISKAFWDMVKANAGSTEGTQDELADKLQELKDSANAVLKCFNDIATRNGVDPIPPSYIIVSCVCFETPNCTVCSCRQQFVSH